MILKEHLGQILSHKTNSRDIFKSLFTAILVSVVVRGTQPSRLLNIEGRKNKKLKNGTSYYSYFSQVLLGYFWNFARVEEEK